MKKRSESKKRLDKVHKVADRQAGCFYSQSTPLPSLGKANFTFIPHSDLLPIYRMCAKIYTAEKQRCGEGGIENREHEKGVFFVSDCKNRDFREFL